MWWRSKPRHQSLPGLEELRARRRERETALRKARREQQLISKRLLRDITDNEDDSLEGDLETHSLSEQQIVQLVKDVQHGSKEKLKSLITLRRGLQHKDVQLMFVRSEGSMRVLIGLFTCPFADVRMEAARCLHELSHSDDPSVTKACLPATSYLLTYLSGHSAEFTSPHMAVLEALGYSLSQLLQSKEAPEKIIPIVLDSGLPQDILRLLRSDSEEWVGVAVEFSWCLHYIISSQLKNTLLISQGIVSKLVLFLTETAALASKTAVQGLELLICPVLRCLGNLLAEVDLAGNKVRIQDGRLLAAIFVFMQLYLHEHPFLVRECLWTLNNLTAEDPVLCSAMLHLNVLPVLFQLLSHSKAVSLLVLTVLCNVADLGPAYCQHLGQKDILPSIITTLGCADTEVKRQSLELLNILFRHCPYFVVDFLHHAGLQVLESLKDQPDLHQQVQAIWNQCPTGTVQLNEESSGLPLD
ncbi:hypothetical protein FKM82_011980 [Ascaphus truei]